MFSLPPSSIAWLALTLSVIAEVLGNIALRYSAGFSRWQPSCLVVLGYGSAIWLMSQALKQLEMGLTYAIWAASGTALTALLGILFYGETANLQSWLGLAFIVLGVILLNINS